MKTFILLAALFASFGTIAGPFGLNKGMTLDEVKKQGNFAPGSQQYVYTAKAMKNGHPDLEYYMVLVTPKTGLCKIKVASKDIESSAFGTELQSKYSELVDALSDKYGTPGNKFDFLKAGSIWTEPQDWMMSLLKKERYLESYWSKPENNNLPDSLKSIGISAEALSGNKGYVTISYEFDNSEACMEAVKSKKNSNL